MRLEEKINEIIAPAVGPVMDIIGELVLDGTAGIVLPGVGNVILSYKQQRTEKNLEEFINKIVQRQDILNAKLENLEPDKLKAIKNHYFGLVTDYVLDVKQKAKIDYMVNGFINLIGIDENKEDIALLYYDTLDELNIIDIRVLKSKSYKYNTNEYWDDIIKYYGIDYSQYKMILEKLCRNGLLEDRNQELREKNNDEVIKYLLDLEKNKKNSKLKYKRISNSTNYVLTSFGNKFLDFFINSDVKVDND